MTRFYGAGGSGGGDEELGESPRGLCCGFRRSWGPGSAHSCGPFVPWCKGGLDEISVAPPRRVTASEGKRCRLETASPGATSGGRADAILR